MENQTVDKLMADIESLKGKLSKQAAKMLDLELTARLVKRLDSFASECEECTSYLNDVRESVAKLEKSREEPTKEDFIAHKAEVNAITSHLQKKHGLVMEGYYTSMYMSTYMTMGISLGLVFGMILFDNIGLGLPIGIGVGVALGAAIGSSKDSECKKKGMVI